MKYDDAVSIAGDSVSHPARGGWIEIGAPMEIPPLREVPPRTGWVD